MTRLPDKRGFDLPTILQAVTLVFLLGDRVFLRSDALGVVQNTLTAMDERVKTLRTDLDQVRKEFHEYVNRNQITRATP